MLYINFAEKCNIFNLKKFYFVINCQEFSEKKKKQNKYDCGNTL